MDQIKKRKLDENGLTLPDPTQTLTESDVSKILDPLTQDQIRNILTTAIITNPDILSAVRNIADRDPTQRKLFIRGLGWETTSESLRSVFETYGELEEAVVILDKLTAKSKGYGFVTFRHIDGAILALKQASKQIDGRVAVASLAAAGGGPAGGGGGGGGGGGDTSLRKIFVGNVPQDMPAERLLSVFAGFGEIEEGPLGFDKATGKSKGFALFVYKTVEGAQMALIEPNKVVDGRQLLCKLASDGKKGKPGGGGDGMGQYNGPSGGVNSGQYPGPGGGGGGPYNGPSGGGGGGGYSSYTGYSGMGQPPNTQMNPPYNLSAGGQGPGGYGGNAGYGSGGGGYGNGGGYGGGSNYGGAPNYSGAPNSGGYGGYGGAGSGGAGRGGYGMPPNSGGVPPGGYSDGGHYGLSSGGYPSQQHQPTGTSPAPRIPPGGAGGYPNPSPYY